MYTVLYCVVHPTPQAVAAMVEECCRFVDQTPDLETKLKLIDTLRTVSEGKVRELRVPAVYDICLLSTSSA